MKNKAESYLKSYPDYGTIAPYIRVRYRCYNVRELMKEPKNTG